MMNPGNPTSPMPQGAPPMPPGGGYDQPSIHVNQQSGMMNSGMQQPGMMNSGMQQQPGMPVPQQPGMPVPQQPGGMSNFQQHPGMMQPGMNNFQQQQQQQQQQPGMMQPPQQPTLNNMNQPPGMVQQQPPQQPTLQNMNQHEQHPGMMNGNPMMNSGMMPPPQQPTLQSMNHRQPPGPPQQPTMNGNVMNRNPPAQATAAGGGNNPHHNRGMLGSRLPRPAYQDPQTNIMYDCDQAEYEGWLTKQSMWLKDWRRRYFILKGNKLFFAKNEYQAPHGMIDLAHCTTVKSADWKSKKRHSFEISTPEITYLLYADTESEKDDWIGRVGKAIVRCSRTYVGQGKGSNAQQTVPGGNSYMQQQQIGGEDSEDDDDIYENDDMENPYYND